MAEESESTGGLLREAVSDTRRLVELEVSLARAELGKEIAQARTGAIAFALAAAAGIAALTMFFVAIPLAFGASAFVACAVGGGLVGVSGIAAIVGWKTLPKQVMGATRSRIETDYKELKERIT